MKISDFGPNGTIQELITSTMYLYLDKNLLHSWDQYFQITKELPYLNTLTLTGNKFKRIDKSYLNGKNVNDMINPYLKELVLIDMSLDWGQIDILAPTFVYIEQLHLVRNNCNKICTQYEINEEHFQNLKFLNVEQNEIESWDELIGFRVLPWLRRLTFSKNKIKEIYYKHGFPEVYMVAMEDNLFSDWKAFDALNQFKQVKVLRSHGNPIFETLGTDLGRQ